MAILHSGLVEQGFLDGAGILRSGGEAASASYGLPPQSVQLFLLIAAAGAQGLTKRRLPKALQEDLALHLLPLELQNLVSWERDNRGRLSYLVLTWKGKEALEQAKEKPSVSWAAKRKAAIRTRA